jgi:oligoribonuclease (3'-5' exoribonuclease)
MLHGITDAELNLANDDIDFRVQLHERVLSKMTDVPPTSNAYAQLKPTLEYLGEGLPLWDH